MEGCEELGATPNADQVKTHPKWLMILADILAYVVDL
jgi:hypothetical protein